MPTLALVLKEVASSAHGTRIVDGLRQLGMTIKVVGKLSCSVLLTNREEQSKAAFLIVGTAKGASFLEDAERLARVFPAHAAILAVREDEAMRWTLVRDAERATSASASATAMAGAAGAGAAAAGAAAAAPPPSEPAPALVVGCSVKLAVEFMLSFLRKSAKKATDAAVREGGARGWLRAMCGCGGGVSVLRMCIMCRPGGRCGVLGSWR